MPEPPTSVMWFRRDLRVDDHPALSAAAKGPTVCLFVVDPSLLGRRHHDAPTRLRFLRGVLESLDEQLRARGGRLVIRYGDPAVVLPELAAAVGASSVHATRELTPFGRRRDRRVGDALAEHGIEFAQHGGDLVVPPELVPGPEGRGYRVFTPFYRAWSKEVFPAPPLTAPEALDVIDIASDSLADAFPSGPPLIPADAASAAAQLRHFAEREVTYYREERDLVADDATSRLSPYLRFGVCTAMQVARSLGIPQPLDLGAEAFWRQVAWREFFHHLMWWRPEAARRALQPRYRGIAWDNAPEHIEAWTTGRTGYPLVDAAMRQLADTGWVHNRARIVAASFLVKDLLVDWRIGERIFMQGLIDGDPANNNGGWQWVASTGTDAAPYFRVLNPIAQSKKFDPEGIYIKRHVPELRRVPDEHIHEPWLMDPELQRRVLCRIGTDYPAPIVDHAEQRRIVVARYRDATDAREETV
jgi:deoxyribodipyrimidine photo-lyase